MKEKKAEKGLSILSKDLYVEVCRDDKELVEAFDHLQIEWLGTSEFVLGLKKFFTCENYAVNTIMVGGTLHGGLKEYAKALRDRSFKYYPNDRLRVFIEGCLRNACVLNNKTGPQESSLGCVSGRPQAGSILFCNDMYTNTVPVNFKHALRRFNHEAALMDCSLANCN